MSETVTKSLLFDSQNGFSLQSNIGYDSTLVGNYYVEGEVFTATPSDYTAVFAQGGATNTYADLGVPVGARVTGIRLLSAAGSFTDGSGSSSATGDVTFSTAEASLGNYDINSIDNSGGAVQPITKLYSDYVVFEISLNGHTVFDAGGYGSLILNVSIVQVEFTYELARNKQFFQSM